MILLQIAALGFVAIYPNLEVAAAKINKQNPNRAEVVVEMAQIQGTERSVSLVGPVWLAEDIGGHGVIDFARTTISFDAHGRVSGSGGCNNFNGKVVINEQQIRFLPLATTRKACPPALMDQEQRFFAALGETESFEIIIPKRKLILKNAAGEPVVRLALTER